MPYDLSKSVERLKYTDYTNCLLNNKNCDFMKQVKKFLFLYYYWNLKQKTTFTNNFYNVVNKLSERSKVVNFVIEY